MCENIHKSTEKFSSKKSFHIILDSTKTCPITFFKHYIKWHFNNVINTPKKEKSDTIETKFESVKILQESLKKTSELDRVVKYIYLRSIFKDDKVAFFLHLFIYPLSICKICLNFISIKWSSLSSRNI